MSNGHRSIMSHEPASNLPARILSILALATLLAHPGDGQVTITESDPRVDALVRYGPGWLAATAEGRSIDGLIRGKWPMVIDYRLESGSASLVVDVDGVDPWRLDLAATGVDGRALAIDDLPKSFGKSLQAATIRIEDEDGRFPAGFHLFGIGCGHKAVGSIAIEDVRFGPEQVDLSAGETARWHYRPLSDFDHGQVTIYRRDVVGTDIESTPIRQLPVEDDPPRNRSVEGSWNGEDGDGALSRGSHTMTVKLWRGTRSEHRKGGDWLVAESATRDVEVR